MWFQSTHSLRSATVSAVWAILPTGVSIHALLAECDGTTPGTLSKRRKVSIHALLAECDEGPCRRRRRGNGFNPRTPCGVRLQEFLCNFLLQKFQSTHSLRSATMRKKRYSKDMKGFNPRTPCGVRQLVIFTVSQFLMFQSTHSLRSATISGNAR